MGSRLLPETSFAVYVFIVTTTQLFGIVGGGGVGTAVCRFVAECGPQAVDRWDRIVRAARTFGAATSILAAMLQCLFAGLIAQAFPSPASVEPLLVLAAPLIALEMSVGLVQAVLAGREEFQLVAWASLARCFSQLTLAPALFVLDGTRGGILALMAASAVHLACLLVLLGPRRTVLFKGSWLGALRAEQSLVTSTCLPAVFSSLSALPGVWFCQIQLARSGLPLIEVAVLALSNQWRSALLILSGVSTQAVLPVFASMHSREEPHRYQSLSSKYVHVTLASALVVACAVALTSPILVNAYDKAYQPYWAVFAIAVFAGALQAASNSISVLFNAANRYWIVFAANLVSLAVWLPLAIALMPLFGSTGAVSAQVLGGGVSVAILGLLRSRSTTPNLRVAVEQEEA